MLNTVLYKKDTSLFYINVAWLSVFFLLFNSNILAATPLAAVYSVITYGYFAFLIFFGAAYFFDRILVKMRVSQMDIIVFLLVIVPIYMAFQANRVWDQSLMSGFKIAIFNVTLVGGLFVYYLLRTRVITVHQYNFASLILCWVSLALYIVLMNTLNPAAYQDSGMVGYNESKGGYVWRFSSSYLTYGIFFYFADFAFNKSRRSLLAFAAIMAYVIFIDKGRILLVTIIGVLGLFLFTSIPFKEAMKKLMTVLVLAAVGLFIAYLIDPELLGIIYKMFEVFFKAIIGMETGENSADSRWIQIGYVLNHFQKYPQDAIFGVGKLSGGFEQIFGHFYLTDIGIFGILFVVGIIGTIYHYAFYAYGAWLLRSIKAFRRDLIFNTMKMTLLFSFINSFFTGGFVWAPLSLLNILVVLHIYKLKQLNMKPEEEAQPPS